MEVDLTCPGCPAGGVEPLPDSGVVGFAGCVRWLDEGDGPADRRPLLDHVPVIGATYLLEVRHPFRARAGADAWVLYEPAAALTLGWRSAADQLPRVAVARIRPRRFMRASSDRAPADQRRGWLVARVEELVFALDLPNRFTVSRAGLPQALKRRWPADEVRVVEHGNLALIERRLPRGQGERALLLQSPLTLPTLLLLEEVGFHEARLQAMVLPLAGDEAGRLRDPAQAFPMRWR